MSLRSDLADYLSTVTVGTEGLEDVKVVRSVRALGEINRPTLVLKTDSYEKLPAAPLLKRLGHFTATLISPRRDIDEAEDQLDELLELFLPALFTFGLSWDSATQVGYGDSLLAFDITIRTILTTEEETDNG